MGRLPIDNSFSEPMDCGAAAVEQEIRHALIGKRKKFHIRGINIQNAQSGERLRSAARPPTAPIPRANAHFSLQDSLRPAVLLAIGAVDDANGGSGSDGTLEKHPGGERLVVWMGSKHHHARARLEERQIHYGRCGFSRTTRERKPEERSRICRAGDKAAGPSQSGRPISCNFSAQFWSETTSVTLITSAPLRVRCSKPASTPPGPSSRKRSQPISSIRSMQSVQRTVPVTWSCSVRRISSADSTASPVTLLITGNIGFCKTTSRSASPTCR